MPEIAKLSQQAEGLKEEVRGLRLAVQQMKPRIERAERVSTRTAVAATIVLMLALALGVVGYRGILTDQRIDGLCPILALVVGSADPNTRTEGPDREEYVRSIEVMRTAYADLGCTTPFVPPRRPDASGLLRG